MKVAVTGASGFIGSHVVRELARRGDIEVVAASRSAPAQPSAPGVRQVVLDFAAPGADPFAALGRPDVLIHLAWQGLPNYGSLHHFDPQLFQHVGFLAGLARAGLKALLCTGTCFEYGMRGGELAEDLPADPQTPYALAKDSLRRYLVFLARATGFQLTWARLFYTWGEGQSSRSLYPQLAAAVQAGARSFPMSSGEQLRDYLPVADVARALVDLATRAPGAGVVNVCSGQPIAVGALVEQWLVQQGWQIELERGAMPQSAYEPMAFWGSTRRLRALLEPA
jgi:nucleoside-diphosphate-sugar epimerase